MIDEVTKAREALLLEEEDDEGLPGISPVAVMLLLGVVLVELFIIGLVVAAGVSP